MGLQRSKILSIRKVYTRKELEKNKICYFCLGCEKLAYEQFKGVNNCKNFIPGMENWYEKYRVGFMDLKQMFGKHMQ